MESIDPPLSQNVVLIGGGHTHALFLRRWGMAPVKGVSLTLINPEATAPYTGMLPGFVAGHYTRNELDIDLVKLARFAGARLIFGMVDGIDDKTKLISVSRRPDVAYDIASIDIGITSNLPNIPGFSEHGVPAKPLGPFSLAWEAFAKSNSPEAAVVIGGGVAGAELALSMRHRLGPTAQISIVEADKLLRGVALRTRIALEAEIQNAKIEIFENAAAKEVTARSVILEDGCVIASHFTVGAAGAVPHSWLRSTSLSLTDGYIDVDANLRSTSCPEVYAVGDCAHLSHAPRPKAGVFAVRAAPVLAANIIAETAGGPLKRFDPQSKYLKLISLGDKRAVADKYSVSPKGAWVWRLKNHIDQAFMNRLNEWPKPARHSRKSKVAKASTSTDPLCGGCGSKVSGDVLAETLGRLEIVERADVLTEPGEDAAVLAPVTSKQVLTTDHLRAFWRDPFLMTRISAIHAMNDVLAMGAAPQAILAQFTLPRMLDSLQSAFLEECLQAANEVASEAGAALVGGHTSMGSEFSVGFTATGLLSKAPLILAGAQPGDVIVLTKPIGSGTILAAEMRGLASGPHVAACLDAMARLELDATTSLSKVASAMTDVTGFGLAGHTQQMADASKVTIEIELERVPLYDGAEELAAAGVRSTIFSANRRSCSASIDDSGRAILLFDPQTSGGMLAAIPEERLSSVEGATIIGRCIAREADPLKLS